ncbi:MAG: hypothetical protein MZV70_00445 [Desulfobacterales bacterium]|nr:hypothetical protein [Desulfobacterales bacterium]
MVGVIVSFITTVLVFVLSDLPMTISPTGLFLSFLSSVTVGILAGIYPSKKATMIQPVNIIRS